MEDTEWLKYGNGRNPKCANCMVHSGYEASAVEDAFRRPLRALKVAWRGPRVAGDMVPELPVLYEQEAGSFPRPGMVAEIKPIPASNEPAKQVA